MRQPDMTRFKPPRESPADEARNRIQSAEQELERLRSRLESELEDALELLRSRDFCGATATLEGVERMATHLSRTEEKLDERRQRLERPEP